MIQHAIQNSVVAKSSLLSKDRQLGCFAPCAFEKGDIIEDCIYLVFTSEEVEKFSAHIVSDYWFENPDDEKERFLLLGNGGIYNHSSEPNIGYEMQDDVFVFYALRDIAEGEELCHDYGDNYDYEGNGFTR